MGLLSRCALTGIPANGSPAEETTLPARSDAASAASVAPGDTKAAAAAMATAVNAVPTQRLAFIVVTFLRWGGTRDYCRSRNNDTPAGRVGLSAGVTGQGRSPDGAKATSGSIRHPPPDFAALNPGYALRTFKSHRRADRWP